MKKIYLLALLFISSLSFGQSQLNYVESDTVYGVGEPGGAAIEITGYLTNTSDATMTVVWEREEIVMEEGWTTQICDVNLCWLSFVDSQSFQIAPGEQLFVKPQFNTKAADGSGIPGCGQVKMRIYEEGNADVNFDELIFYARAGDVDCEGFDESLISGIEDELVQTLSLYPNPVLSDLNISMTNIDNASKIEIYNLTGKRVDRISLEGETKLRISAYDWNEGMYILSVLDDSDRVIKTQRFSKVQ